MKRSRTEELVAELEAEDRLRARGYRKLRCRKCGGTGQWWGRDELLGSCVICGGYGWTWEPPICIDRLVADPKAGAGLQPGEFRVGDFVIRDTNQIEQSAKP